jgi:hypothetical protein
MSADICLVIYVCWYMSADMSADICLLIYVCGKKNPYYLCRSWHPCCYQPKKFRTPEIFRDSWLTNSIRIQFVDIFVTHPHSKVHISNNMTLWSHVWIILNYPACYHAKNKINNSLESDVTLRRIYQFITTSHDNKSQFCGAKLCNYNGHIKAITIKYHDRMIYCALTAQHASRICVAPYYVQDRHRFLIGF